MIDLSRLESMGRTAVRCTSEEQASIFMESMFKQYPRLVSGVWRKGQTNWERYRDKGVIYYLPRIVCEPGEIDYCQSSSMSTRERGKYNIVEFDELIYCPDYGEFMIPELDENIKTLLEIG